MSVLTSGLILLCEIFVLCVLQSIGCDYVINSSAVEDRCGVCNGNGSTCTTVKRTFEDSEGLGIFFTCTLACHTWKNIAESFFHEIMVSVIARLYV